MKNVMIILLCLTVTLTACWSDESSEVAIDRLPPLEIQIPAELESKTEVVDFIKRSEKSINDWTRKIEDLIADYQPYAGKSDEELTMREKIKVASIAGRFVANSFKLLADVAEFESEAQRLENNFTKEEEKAFEVVLHSFVKRIEELNERYEKYGEQLGENDTPEDPT